jgi:hypothetical protein
MSTHALLNLEQAKAHKRAGLGFTRTVCGQTDSFSNMARSMEEIGCSECLRLLVAAQGVKPTPPVVESASVGAAPVDTDIDTASAVEAVFEAPATRDPIVDEDEDGGPIAGLLEHFSSLLPEDFVFVDNDTLLDEPEGPYDPRSRLNRADRELLATLLGLGGLMLPQPTYALRSILTRALGLAVPHVDVSEGSPHVEPLPADPVSEAAVPGVDDDAAGLDDAVDFDDATVSEE